MQELLERRTDLSTFLVHLTRDYDGRCPEENLLSMATELRIEARNPFGLARAWEPRLASSDHTQRAVCLSETPLEHVWMLCEPIEGRSAAMSSYGWIFTREHVRRMRSNPVWYLDTTPSGGVDWLTKPIQALITEAVGRSRVGGHIDDTTLARERIFEITPYLETMGGGRAFKKDFHWEREWRHVGHLDFTPGDVVAVFAPEDRHEILAQRFDSLRTEWSSTRRPFLDPQWSLERSVAALASGGWMVRQAGPH